MTRFLALASSALGLVLATSAASADPVKSQGELGTEGRLFLPGAEGDAGNVAGVGRLTLDAKARPFKLRARGFFRHDGIDRERSALFPEEAWVEWKENPFRVRLGYQLLNWTATEAFHPADIINSRYLDGNIQNPEKLGELMASARYKFLDGNIEAFFMPTFTAPITPSASSRFRFGPEGLSLEEPMVLDWDGQLKDGPLFAQWGARVQQTIGDSDLSLHFVQHIDRSLPLVLVNFDATGQPAPSLVYQGVMQVGGTYQEVWGPIIVKVEGAYRNFDDPTDGQLRNLPQPPDAMFVVPDRDHGIVASGLEYSYYHDEAQSTLLLEGQYAIGYDRRANEGALLLFDRDALAGYRFAFNDVDDKTITASVIVDVVNPEQVFGNAVYAQRIGDTWRGEAGFRFISFPAKDPENPQGPEYLDDASYVHTSLIRFF